MPKKRINVKQAADLEKVLGYKFKKKELLSQALTHSSAITENHPTAFCRDLSPLAFVGDAVLKYVIARYLFLNGRADVINSPQQLHEGAQEVVTNGVLARIAHDKLHLEDYLVRGNSHVTLNKNMYADCMEAIFGAISLDCENDQQVIFGVIEQLCSQCIEKWLEETAKVKPQGYYDEDEDEDEDDWITEDILDWPKDQLQAALSGYRATSLPPKRSCLETFSRCCLWIFAVFGFVTFCCLLIIGFINFHLKDSPRSGWSEL
jgi:dsRNA-specific ribonuclease